MTYDLKSQEGGVKTEEYLNILDYTIIENMKKCITKRSKGPFGSSKYSV